MSYTSIFGGQTASAPSASSAPTGSSYKSILPSLIKAAAPAKASRATEVTALKKQFTPDPAKVAQTQAAAQQADAQVAKNTTKGFSPKNLGIATRDVGVATARFVPRAGEGLAATADQAITGKPQSFQPNRVGRYIFGTEPVQSSQVRGANAAASHPGGFKLPVINKTLSPAATGAGEAGLSFLNDLLGVKGGIDSVAKPINKFNARTAATKTTAKNVAVQDVLNKAKEPVKPTTTPVKTQPAPLGKNYTLDNYANKGDVLTVVDANKLQAAGDKQLINFGAKDRVTRTPSGNKLMQAKDFISKNDSIKAPALSFNKNGQIHSLEGAHRFRALKEMGNGEVVVSVPKEHLENLTQSGIVKRPLENGMPKLAPKDASAPVVPKPKVKMPGEEGAVAPGAAVSDVKSLISKHQASTKFSGDLQDSITRSGGNKAVIAEDVGKAIDKRTPISNTDKQILQDYRDAKAAGLKPKPLPAHLVAEDADVTKLNTATQAHDAELARLNGQEAKAETIERRDPTTYTHREVQGKGTSLDYLAQGDRKNPLSVGGLGKTAPSSKSRTLMNLTDEEGNRRAVSIKNRVLKDENGNKIAQGKLVNALDTGENIGKLKFNTDRDFLDKELKPYQTKIKNLQKEGDALSKVKTSGGVSDARIDSLARKVSLLEDPGNLIKLTKSERRSLQQSKLKLQELTRVKPTKTNATGRLKTINQHLIKMTNEVNKIHDKYDPETLDDKVFVGKDGKKYTLGQATTSEITKASGGKVKYYTDPKLMALKNYGDTRTALENARFLESLKTHPDFEKFASEPGKTAPKGWKSVNGLDQFRGYKFEPKIREVLLDLVKNNKDEASLYEDVGHVLRQAIVYFPLKHVVNEGFTYQVDRGLSSLVNPLAYKRGAQALTKAFHDVTNQSEDFQATQKAGLHMTTGGEDALSKSFKKGLQELSDNDKTMQDVAKQWGTSPVRLYRAIQHTTVWELQDILNMARVNERMAPKLFSKGESLEDAVAHTRRNNLQYHVPSRIGPRILPGRAQRGLSRAARSPVVFFGRYKYDQFRIINNIIKDTTNLKTLKNNPKANAQALDRLAALAVGAAVLWPLVDKAAQKLSGNPNAYISAPGIGGPVETGIKVAKGKQDAISAIGNQVSLSGAVTLPLDLKNNRDPFTGKQIYDPNSSYKQRFADVGKWLNTQQSTTQQFTQATGGKNKAIDTLLTLASARLPKNAPEVNKLNSLKYDSLPDVQTNAKAKAAKGDINGAISDIKAYDSQLLDATRKALLAAGQSVPDDKTLEAKLKEQGYYYNPTRATVQGWASPSAKQGTLQSILSANPAPKKGDPGYLQYTLQQKQKAKLNKFKSPASKQTVLP